MATKPFQTLGLPWFGMFLSVKLVFLEVLYGIQFCKMKITPLGILSSILEGLPNEVVDRNKDTIDWEFV